MKTLSYTVRFLTPAFLGNAEQSGQWRTPPFKALLRQWWQVAVAAQHDFNMDVKNMRHAEGLLFGHAWLEDDLDLRGNKIPARKSSVRLRLDKWDTGKLTAWEVGKTVEHPEVRFPVDANLYMGYGPVTLPKGARSPSLKANAAIQAGEYAELSLAFPDEHAQEIETALWLMDRYGTLGGRSRNGWGSFSLLPAGTAAPIKKPIRDWQQALKEDWPHTIGMDDQPLIWQTKAHADWKTLMKELAEIKIGLRTQFKFTTGRDTPAPEERHWLSYPVTNHSVKLWGGNARLPNSLRFKVRQDADNKLRGAIFHVPCKPPAKQFDPKPETLHKVWQKVHRHLDDNPSITRITE